MYVFLVLLESIIPTRLAAAEEERLYLLCRESRLFNVRTGSGVHVGDQAVSVRWLVSCFGEWLWNWKTAE
jgi:hypothetical protein